MAPVGAQGCAAAGSLHYHKRPCREGVPERIKRGREKVVTRAVAPAVMLSFVEAERGYARHCRKFEKISDGPAISTEKILWRV